MADIVLSASVRQNLLSLQSTADLLSQTQTRLATGNKVNNALDNPTNYFTALGLNNRASDINNLLDSIGNGIQVIQAANTGITSLQKLVDTAKSVANQSLQATSGYLTKSQLKTSTAITGATADNILGTGGFGDVAVAAGTAVSNNTTVTPYNKVVSGSEIFDNQITGTFDGTTIGATQTTAATITGTGVDLSAASSLGTNFLDGQTFSITIGGVSKTFEFDDDATTTTGNVAVSIGGTEDLSDLVTAINGATGFDAIVASDDGTGHLKLTTDASSVTNAAHYQTALTDSITLDPGTTSALGFVSASVTAPPTTASVQANRATYTGGVVLSGANSLNGFTDGQTFTIKVGATSKTFEFDQTATAGVTSGNIGITVTGKTGSDLVNAINDAFGSTVASLDTTGHLKLDSGSETIQTTQSTGGAAIGLAAGTNTYTPATTLLTGNTTSATGAMSGFAAGDEFTVNGKTVQFVDPAAPGATTSFNAFSGGTIRMDGTLKDVLDAINTIAGGNVASVVNGHINIDATQAPAGTDVKIGGDSNVLSSLGLAAVPATITNTGGAASATDITATSLLASAPSSTSSGLSNSIVGSVGGVGGESITVNGTVIKFSADATSGGVTFDGTSYTVDLHNATVGDLVNTIDKITGTFGTANASTISGGKINLSTGSANLELHDSGATDGDVLSKLGLGSLVGISTPNQTGPAAITGATALSSTASGTSDGLATAFDATDTIVVNNKTITFSTTAATSTGNGGGVINLSTGSVQDVLDAIDQITGTYGTANKSTISATGQISLHTGVASDLDISGSGLAKLGLTATQTDRTSNSTLAGRTLDIASTDGGNAAHIVFGTDDAAGEVSSLAELNAKLKTDGTNLEASIDTQGFLTITTTNDHAHATIGAISGDATTYLGSPFGSSTVAGPVENIDAQNLRAGLVSQYNNIIDQIRTTAQDASFNGVNLLNGDQLKMVFNETGRSTLTIEGVTDDPTGLGLAKLTSGSDFLDNSSTNKILDTLNSASATLRTQASALGANLSVVQIRQDFSKNLINVLQTGASNLTLADTNEEAANSQALSTRQSIAVSALALANQSNQSVLRLLQ